MGGEELGGVETGRKLKPEKHEVKSKGLVEPHSEAWQGLGRHKRN